MGEDIDNLDSTHDDDMDSELQISNNLDLNVEQDCRSPKFSHVEATQVASRSLEDDTNANGVLKIGTVFESDEHAYRFYNKYARLLGFSVRKDWVNRSKVHGQVASRKFTCSKEGYRRKDKRDVNVKKHRKETRTGCLAHMIITRQPDGKYRVTQLEANHNHGNINPDDPQIMQLQKELLVLQAAGVEQPSHSGTQSNLAHEEMNRRWELRESLDCLSTGYVNYLQSERARDIKEGEAGRLLRYFQRHRFENPSFFYALQLDIDDKVSNIFWADDTMIVDYDHFGDVVCLDTSCRRNKDFQPFVQFVGVNHHNQAVIFAAALLFDDTVESLKWLLHTFLEVMSGKKPKVILTDQDASIVQAIDSVLPEIDHHICVWQMHGNALKHLKRIVKDSESFAAEFRSCIYENKDEEGFISAWETLLETYGLKQNEWLRWMFREREKWAVVYGKNTFFVDMKNKHLVENLSNDLRSYLNSDEDLLHVFKHFERVVDEQRFKEMEADNEMNRCLPRLMGKVVMLKHAGEVYTPRAFEVFQREYERSLNVVIDQCSINGLLTEYKVKTFGQIREYTVTFDSSDETLMCSCLKFEYVGFLCSHVLKVLDYRNIKVVPSQYILKRWTKDARTGSVQQGCDVIEQEKPKVAAARRYKDLCHSILKMSSRAAESEEAYQFASKQLGELIAGVEKILMFKPEELQTSGGTSSNASASENAEVFLYENEVEGEDEVNRVQETKAEMSSVPNRRKPKIANGRSSETKRVQNVQRQSPTTVNCISNTPPAFVSPQDSTPNSVVQGLYNFEANQVVHCIFQQPTLIIDQQSNSDMFQQPNFYPDQHDSPSHTQLLPEPLIRNSYHECVSNTTQLRQAMELDVPHSHSSSFLLYDHRYRAPDSTYLAPK